MLVSFVVRPSFQYKLFFRTERTQRPPVPPQVLPLSIITLHTDLSIQVYSGNLSLNVRPYFKSLNWDIKYPLVSSFLDIHLIKTDVTLTVYLYLFRSPSHPLLQEGIGTFTVTVRLDPITARSFVFLPALLCRPSILLYSLSLNCVIIFKIKF